MPRLSNASATAPARSCWALRGANAAMLRARSPPSLNAARLALPSRLRPSPISVTRGCGDGAGIALAAGLGVGRAGCGDTGGRLGLYGQYLDDGFPVTTALRADFGSDRDRLAGEPLGAIEVMQQQRS